MAGFFSSGGELKIKTAEDLVKVLKGEPGVPGIQGSKGDSYGYISVIVSCNCTAITRG